MEDRAKRTSGGELDVKSLAERLEWIACGKALGVGREARWGLSARAGSLPCELFPVRLGENVWREGAGGIVSTGLRRDRSVRTKSSKVRLQG